MEEIVSRHAETVKMILYVTRLTVNVQHVPLDTKETHAKTVCISIC